MSTKPVETPTRRGGRGPLVYGALGLFALVLMLMLIPSVQGPRKWRPSQFWRNMRQIGVALQVYNSQYGRLPYDSRGADYALYALSAELPASAFDGYPREKPHAEARWDHVNGRLEGSDFEYLNTPPQKGSMSHRIVLAEKPGAGYESVTLMLGNGVQTACRAPQGTSKDLLGNWESSDQFLFKDRQLFQEWEAVPLPPQGGTEHGNSVVAEGSIWNTRATRLDYGAIQVHFEYAKGELIRRTFQSPEGNILDSVTTDELGRIKTLDRAPKNWRDFWPIHESSH